MTRRKKILILVFTIIGLYAILAIADIISLNSRSGKAMEVKVSSVKK